MSEYIKLEKCTVGELVKLLIVLDPKTKVEVPIYPPGDDYVDNVGVDIYDDHVVLDGF